MTDEVIITDNGQVSDDPTAAEWLLKEKDAKIAELDDMVRRQDIAINVLRQRLIEVELELVNERCGRLADVSNR